MRDEIDGTLEGLRAGAKRRVEDRKSGGDTSPAAEPRSGKLASQVRGELAQAVRNLSAALDKMAGSVEPSQGEVVVEAEVVEASNEDQTQT
jgi:hypothetical protein